MLTAVSLLATSNHYAALR